MKKLLLLLALAASPFTMSAKFVTKSVPYEHDGVKLEGEQTYDDLKALFAK